MRLVEKDSHDKQELVSSLRKQLEDVKNINIEMNSRLQVGRRKLLNKYDTHMHVHAHVNMASSLNSITLTFLKLPCGTCHGEVSGKSVTCHGELGGIDHVTGKSQESFRVSNHRDMSRWFEKFP